MSNSTPSDKRAYTPEDKTTYTPSEVKAIAHIAFDRHELKAHRTKVGSCSECIDWAIIEMRVRKLGPLLGVEV